MTLISSLQSKFKKKYSTEDRKSFGFCYLLLLIPVAQFVVFWVIVNINSITFAFTDSFGNPTLDNFKDVFYAFRYQDEKGWNLGMVLVRSLILWFSVNIICTPLIMLSTYILYRRIAGHYVFRVLFAIPQILGAIVWTSLVIVLVSGGKSGGPIINMAINMGIDVPEEIVRDGLLANKNTAFITILLVNIIPHVIACDITLTGAFTRIPAEVMEASKLDGVPFFSEFIHIALPLAWPTIVINFVTALATILIADGQVFLYTMGEYETATMGFYIYYMVYNISQNGAQANAFGYPAALGLLLTVATMPIVILAKHFLEKPFRTGEEK